MIENSTWHFTTTTGRKLFVQKWSKKDSSTKKALLLTHGHGEHSDAYNNLASYLAKSTDYSVYGWDLTGHGKSEGMRGYVGSFSWFVKDIAEIYNHVKENTSLGSIALFGHSLGGLLTLLLQEKVAEEKVILSNPCLGLALTVPGWKKAAAKALAKTLPWATLGNEINPRDLSSDEEYIESFRKDPMRHNKASPRLFLGLVEEIENIDDKKISFKKTPLVLLSPKDPIVSYETSRNYFSQQGHEVSIFENSLHEIVQDSEKERAYTEIKEYLNS